MKIPKKYRPELIVSKDRLRESLQNVEITEHNGSPVAVATDGRKLVVIPVEADKSEHGQLPPSALKFARQAMSSKRQDNLNLEVTEKAVTFENGWSMPREEQGKFPNIAEVIPSRVAAFKICLNAEFLSQLAKAMGTDNVTLEFGQSMDPIVVKAPGDKSFGVLMPVRIA